MMSWSVLLSITLAVCMVLVGPVQCADVSMSSPFHLPAIPSDLYFECGSCDLAACPNNASVVFPLNPMLGCSQVNSVYAMVADNLVSEQCRPLVQAQVCSMAGNLNNETCEVIRDSPTNVFSGVYGFLCNPTVQACMNPQAKQTLDVLRVCDSNVLNLFPSLGSLFSTLFTVGAIAASSGIDTLHGIASSISFPSISAINGNPITSDAVNSIMSQMQLSWPFNGTNGVTNVVNATISYNSTYMSVDGVLLNDKNQIIAPFNNTFDYTEMTNNSYVNQSALNDISSWSDVVNTLNFTYNNLGMDLVNTLNSQLSQVNSTVTDAANSVNPLANPDSPVGVSGSSASLVLTGAVTGSSTGAPEAGSQAASQATATQSADLTNQYSGANSMFTVNWAISFITLFIVVFTQL